MVKWHLGTMGFAYKQWVGPFFPAGMAPSNFLSHYSQLFDAVEIDSTFYGPPSTKTVKRWYSVTPPDFTFSLKTPRTITHERRLVGALEPMSAFLEKARVLEGKLGAVLIQLPPDFTHDAFLPLMRFLEELPDDIRFAIEFRHRSWNSPGTTTLLERHNVCFTAADYSYMPKNILRTADFLYLRFLGPRGRYPSKDREFSDRTAELSQWQQRIQLHLAHVSDSFAFFNNDFTGFAPAACNRFRRILGIEDRAEQPWRQQRLI